MTKCLSCGYIHRDIALNCQKCGSFYTEVIAFEVPKNAESETLGVLGKIKHTLEHLIPHGVSHD